MGNRNADRRPDSRVLHTLEGWLSHPGVAACVVGADAVWVAVSIFAGVPNRLEVIFQTLVAAVTLAMVLIIQHTQARQQTVIQRKLDELLSAVPRTDEAVIGLEAGSDDELHEVTRSHRRFRAGEAER